MSSFSFLQEAGTVIPEEADLNDYTTGGKYVCSGQAIAATCKNCPEATSFSLYVMKQVNSSVLQILVSQNNNMFWYRIQATGSWRDWLKLRDFTEDIDNIYNTLDFFNDIGELIPDGTDLDTITTPGKYYKPTASADTLVNTPTTSSLTLFVFAHINSGYKIQVLFGSQSNNALVYVRFLSSANGGWSKISVSSV